MKPSPLNHDSLRLVSYCPLCEARYAHGNARLLAEEGETRLIHVTCKKCGGATLSLVLENPSGGSSVGMVTDLTHDDVVRLHRSRKVTTDDVIDVHKALGSALTDLFSVPLRKRRTHAKVSVKSRRVARP
jgi:hypothetical protein